MARHMRGPSLIAEPHIMLCDSLYKYISSRIIGEVTVFCAWQLCSLNDEQLQQLGLTSGACKKFLSSIESR